MTCQMLPAPSVESFKFSHMADGRSPVKHGLSAMTSRSVMYHIYLLCSEEAFLEYLEVFQTHIIDRGHSSWIVSSHGTVGCASKNRLQWKSSTELSVSHLQEIYMSLTARWYQHSNKQNRSLIPSGSTLVSQRHNNTRFKRRQKHWVATPSPSLLYWAVISMTQSIKQHVNIFMDFSASTIGVSFPLFPLTEVMVIYGRLSIIMKHAQNACRTDRSCQKHGQLQVSPSAVSDTLETLCQYVFAFESHHLVVLGQLDYSSTSSHCGWENAACQWIIDIAMFSKTVKKWWDQLDEIPIM